MELWIRSQNRESLVKVNNVFIYYEFEKQYVIQSQDNINISYRLGKYKTKKRAIEVLDEIQEYLERECRKEEIDFEMNGVQHSSMRYAIYEMPKE